jgi:hypothetical protein
MLLRRIHLKTKFCKLPMDTEKFATFNCDFKLHFDSFCLGTSLRTICHFDPKAFEFHIIAEKM